MESDDLIRTRHHGYYRLNNILVEATFFNCLTGIQDRMSSVHNAAQQDQCPPVPVRNETNASTSANLNTPAFLPPTSEMQRDSVSDTSIEAGTTASGSTVTVSGGVQPVITMYLQPGEKYMAQAGAMLYRDPRITMELFPASDRATSSARRGMIGRFLSGESLYLVEFENTADSAARLSLSPSRIGQMLQLKLDQHPEGICADNGAFFAGSPTVELSIIRAAGKRGLFSGMGYFQQHISGSGDLVLFSPGSIQEVKLVKGEQLAVDSGAVFAWEKSVDVKLEYQGLKKGLFGGEGLYTAHE